MAAAALAAAQDSRADLVAALSAIRPAPLVVADDEGLKPFETDAYISHRGTPLVAVLPDDEAQVREVLGACRKRRVPVVTRGAGTGISGGAIPLPDGVLLVMTRMRRIRELDVELRQASVQPGVRNAHVSEVAAEHGLFYAPDPSSQSVCSIGGNVAENAGGVHCLKYGLTVHNVMAVRAIDIEGDVLELGSTALDWAGYDLLALMIGSEGNLGVVTRATLKLLPLAEKVETLLAAFPTVGDAARAVGEIIGAGVVPASLEMMDRVVIDACERCMELRFPADAQALLLAEVDGSPEEVAVELATVRGIMEDSGATEIRVANDEAERAQLWRARKGAFTALATILPDYYTIDGTIPRRLLAEILGRIYSLAEEYGMTVGNVFHAGDGNIHPCIFYDASRPGELERSESLGGRILEICVEMGGTITGEHGVGLEKLKQMCVQFRDGELGAFHAVKGAFDPDGLLNPGKAVPTLKRCAEWGGMHVRGGVVPHAEIPRF